jgi:dipeptidyl aminopeptidase/acylaminoacyl peptidase
MMLWISLLFPVLCLGTERFTLKQIMASGFPSELTAAPSGGRLALIVNTQGVRNIYVAGPPDYRARAVTTYNEDDGQELSSIGWSPDGSRIVYVRGGGPNRAGEIPNPMNDPKGTEQAIWMIPAAGGVPKRLAEGSSPAVSPLGDRVVYLSKGQIWWTAIDGSGKPQQLIKSRGTAGSLEWSPDGALLAFVSNRGGHSFIGIYDIEKKSLTFADPSLDRDSAPAWSPGGRRLAFVRRPASREFQVFGPRRTAEPWSIRVFDVATGEAHQVWRAEPGRGSVWAAHALPASSQMYWGGADILFCWEREGWNHLYAVTGTGGTAVPLTRGEFEVEQYTLTRDRKFALVTSNQRDIDRRHLWKISLDTGASKQLTSGAGIEWAGVVTSDGKAMAWLASSARQPAHAVIKTGDSAPRLLVEESVPTKFPSGALVEPKAVMLDATDGMKIPAQLFLPEGLKPGEKRPAAIFFHGGSRRQMLLGWHYSPYYHNCYALTQYLVSRGWIGLSVNYRSGIGYGMEFREALDYGATGASEFRDVLGAGLYLRNHPNVDGRRIAVWGGSYGGYLTAMALSRASDLFAAGVDIHGVHDWNVVTRNFVPSYDPLAHQTMARLALESSPMASVRNWRSPVLLIHGDDDRNVPFSESAMLVEELRKQQVHVEQLVFPDEVHSFLRHAHWVRAWEAAAGFLERRLGAAQ